MPILILFIGLMVGLLLSTAVPLQEGEFDSGVLYDLAIGLLGGLVTGVVVSIWCGYSSFLRERLDSMKGELWDNCYHLSEALGRFHCADKLNVGYHKQLLALLHKAESFESFCAKHGLNDASCRFSKVTELLHIAEADFVMSQKAFDQLQHATKELSNIAPLAWETLLKLPCKRFFSSSWGCLREICSIK